MGERGRERRERVRERREWGRERRERERESVGNPYPLSHTTLSESVRLSISLASYVSERGKEKEREREREIDRERERERESVCILSNFVTGELRCHEPSPNF
jgi:hypothetical protein